MSNDSCITCFVLLLVTACAVVAILIRPVPVVVHTNLERLPMEIGRYTAREDSFSDAIYRELNTDKSIYRHYWSENGDQLDLYIGYYGTSKGGRTGHNPYACLPGAGWAIVDSQKVTLRDPLPAPGVEVNYIRARRDGTNIIMVHWYQSVSRVISTGFQQNLDRFVGKAFHNRNDGAFVRITASATDEDIPRARQRVEQFAGRVLSQLPHYWPVER